VPAGGEHGSADEEAWERRRENPFWKQNYTVVFRDEDDTTVETSVTGGHCKLQWKCDWAMRWVALAVDYEMAGKDLLDSGQLSSQMRRMLGGRHPTR
jgi:lysyl-tRNA synthetase class I